MRKNSGNYDALLKIHSDWQKTRLILHGEELLEAQENFLAEVKRLQPREKTDPLTPADVLAQLRANALLIKHCTRRATNLNPGRAVNQRVARDDVVLLWNRGYAFADAHGLRQPPNEPTEPYSAPELCNALARFVDWCDSVRAVADKVERAEPKNTPTADQDWMLETEAIKQLTFLQGRRGLRKFATDNPTKLRVRKHPQHGRRRQVHRADVQRLAAENEAKQLESLDTPEANKTSSIFSDEALSKLKERLVREQRAKAK